MPIASLRGELKRVPFSVALTALTFLCCVISGCHRSHAGPGAVPEVLVRVIHPTRSDAQSAEYTGTIHERIESELGFRVSGKIIKRYVSLGQHVHRGQALMSIDAANLSLAASAAHQRLLAAEAEAARAAAEEARQKKLLSEGAISTASYETGLAASRAATANNIAAQAAAQDADLQLQYATLTASADGLIMDIYAEPGQVVQPGTRILRLAQAGTREALIFIPEGTEKGLAREGVARVLGNSQAFAVHLRELSESADPTTRTFAARYTIQAPLAEAPLGATITLTLKKQIEPTLEVPLAALHDGGHGVGVWVVSSEGLIRFRAVTIKSLQQETAEIAPGALTPQDVIVALGAHLLRERDRVRILKDSA